MKRAGIVLLSVMLFLSGFISGGKEIQAAERPYEINITEVKPQTAEKKLRKVKSESKRPLYLKVKAANEKDARKKIKSWMRKFQNLKTSTYGVLPAAYDDVVYKCLKSDMPGYYIYGKADAPGFTKTFSLLASDYVNMNTICKRAVRDGVNWSGVKPWFYYEDYNEYMSNFDIFYQSMENPEVCGVIQSMHADSVFSNQEKHGIFQRETVNAAEIKKKSDSFRTQFYRKNMSGLIYDRKFQWKEITLYDVAKNKGRGVCSDLAGFTRRFLISLFLDVDAETVSNHKADHALCIWRAKGDDGKWDYFEANNEDVYSHHVRSSLSMFRWLDKGEIEKDSKLKGGFYQYVKYGNYSEADQQYLRYLAETGLKPEIEKQIYMEIEGLEEPQQIQYELRNNNPRKYGVEKVSGVYAYRP